jgi:primosomal protein N' (replication factor Y)
MLEFHMFFTYKSTEILEVGRIVVVPWGKKESIATIAEIIDTQKDSSITIKDIKVITDNIINKKYLEFILWISEHYLAPVISIADVAGLNRNFKLKQNNNKNTVLEDTSTLNYDYIEKALLNIHLNEAQDVVYNKIKNSTKRYLLEGVTGSGKTYVYLKVALDTVVHGKQVLILLPEILLSKQIKQDAWSKVDVHSDVKGYSTEPRSEDNHPEIINNTSE